MDYVGEQHRLFFETPRWYNSDTPRCDYHAIVGGRVYRCEGCVGHEGGHPLTSTRKLAGAAEYALHDVKKNFLM
jgi:hypothetical protein